MGKAKKECQAPSYGKEEFAKAGDRQEATCQETRQEATCQETDERSVTATFIRNDEEKVGREEGGEVTIRCWHFVLIGVIGMPWALAA